jgi:DnaJ homolog subfamily A member 5
MSLPASVRRALPALFRSVGMASASGPATRECFYTILEVEMDATEADIRKGYRRQALKWHPDKNMHRMDEATNRMKLITEAYTVLSDASERAWYDAHRESILRGSDGTGGDSSDMLPNLWSFFSTSSFKGFDDGPESFFSVYSKAFDSISRAEARHRDRAAPPSTRKWPEFGTAESPWTSVAAFYRTWMNYVSEMTFAWEDLHHPNEAGDRYTRRWMDRQNDKARHTAREQWIEEVRALAKFVQKRDPRVQEEARRAAEERERRREEREARLAEELRAKEEESQAIAKAAEEYWAELDAAQGFRLDDEEDAMVGRSKSKRKQKRRGRGQDEDERAAAAAAGAGESGAVVEEMGSLSEDLEGDLAALKGAGLTAEMLLAEFEISKDMMESAGIRQEAITDQVILRALREDETIPAFLTNAMVLSCLAHARGAASAKPPAVPTTEPPVAETEPAVSEAPVESPPPKPRICRVCGAGFGDVPSLVAHIKETGHNATKPKLETERLPTPSKTPKSLPGDPVCACVVCHAVFGSRSKLFRHLQQTGHSAPPSMVDEAAAKGKKGKKGKGKRRGKHHDGEDDEW